MYVTDDNILKVAGLVESDLVSFPMKQDLNEKQMTALFMFYLGRKIEDLNNSVQELNNTIKDELDSSAIVEAIQQLKDAWRGH